MVLPCWKSCYPVGRVLRCSRRSRPVGCRFELLDVVSTFGSGLALLEVVLPCWKSFGAVGSGLALLEVVWSCWKGDITLLEVVGFHFEARLDIAPQIMQKREIAFKSVGQNAKSGGPRSLT